MARPVRKIDEQHATRACNLARAQRIFCVLVLLGGALTPAAAQAPSGLRVDTMAVADAGSGGLLVDDKGFVYTADFGAVLGDPSTAGAELHRIAPDGTVTVFAEGFEGASGNAFDSSGNIFQSNIRGGYISVVDAEGNVKKFASEGVAAPVGIAINEDDTLFVANCGGASIQKITADGTSTRFLDSTLLKCPNGIVIDDESNLYVANFYDGNVIKITPQAEASVLATLPGNNNGHLTFANGVLYVVARTAHQVWEVTLEGETRLIAGSGEKGGLDGPADKAEFCYPNDIGASRDGKVLYVNEVENEESKGFILGPTRIRRIYLGD